jgi:hypothetical protein
MQQEYLTIRPAIDPTADLSKNSGKRTTKQCTPPKGNCDWRPSSISGIF